MYLERAVPAGGCSSLPLYLFCKALRLFLRMVFTVRSMDTRAASNNKIRIITFMTNEPSKRDALELDPPPAPELPELPELTVPEELPLAMELPEPSVSEPLALVSNPL